MRYISGGGGTMGLALGNRPMTSWQEYLRSMAHGSSISEHSGKVVPGPFSHRSFCSTHGDLQEGRGGENNQATSPIPAAAAGASNSKRFRSHESPAFCLALSPRSFDSNQPATRVVS